MREFDDSCTACEQLNKFLFEYADGELDQEHAKRLEKHVSECPYCKDRVDAEMHVRELVRRCYNEHAPSNLRTRVISRIRTTHLRIETYE
ncbi:MAG: mycothiol system anti-sigma-R factor [Actinomycetaceae bacterium]|nr:mycothiol system anti-sigma-R factor [Actinomycetaceae bacterium]